MLICGISIGLYSVKNLVVLRTIISCVSCKSVVTYD